MNPCSGLRHVSQAGVPVCPAPPNSHFPFLITPILGGRPGWGRSGHTGMLVASGAPSPARKQRVWPLPHRLSGPQLPKLLNDRGGHPHPGNHSEVTLGPGAIHNQTDAFSPAHRQGLRSSPTIPHTSPPLPLQVSVTLSLECLRL